MDNELREAIEEVRDAWERGDLASAVNNLCGFLDEDDAVLSKKDGKEFEELFKEWCDSAEAQQLYTEPESMHDSLELFFALGRDRRTTPIVMSCNGMESAVYQYPAETVKVYVLDYESIDDCILCQKDLNGESECPHCGFDNTLTPDDAWTWIKAREGVVSNG